MDTLPKPVPHLDAVFSEEHARRLLFYEEMTDDGKTEFINGEVFRQIWRRWPGSAPETRPKAGRFRYLPCSLLQNIPKT